MRQELQIVQSGVVQSDHHMHRGGVCEFCSLLCRVSFSVDSKSADRRSYQEKENKRWVSAGRILDAQRIGASASS